MNIAGFGNLVACYLVAPVSSSRQFPQKSGLKLHNYPTHGLFCTTRSHLAEEKALTTVGFEPTPLARPAPKAGALDHSATLSGIGPVGSNCNFC